MPTYTIEIPEIPFEIEITHYYPGDPGMYCGPPERCYPPEEEEVEFTVKLWGTEIPSIPEEFYDGIKDAVLDKIHHTLPEPPDYDPDFSGF